VEEKNRGLNNKTKLTEGSHDEKAYFIDERVESRILSDLDAL
jgi:hypothetical protein